MFDLTTLPAARAGLICHLLADLKDMIETERLPPLVSSGVPLCSAQYERLFATTRIPGVEAGTANNCVYTQSSLALICIQLFYLRSSVFI